MHRSYHKQWLTKLNFLLRFWIESLYSFDVDNTWLWQLRVSRRGNGAVRYKERGFDIISFGESVLIIISFDHPSYGGLRWLSIPRSWCSPEPQLVHLRKFGDSSCLWSVVNFKQRKMEVEKQIAAVRPTPLLLQAVSKVSISPLIFPAFYFTQYCYWEA